MCGPQGRKHIMASVTKRKQKKALVGHKYNPIWGSHCYTLGRKNTENSGCWAGPESVVLLQQLEKLCTCGLANVLSCHQSLLDKEKYLVKEGTGYFVIIPGKTVRGSAQRGEVG